jgi:hypothetical protein
MADTTTQGSGGAPETRDPEQIEAEIEQTREELADTVGAAAEKADVKKEAKRKVEETKARVRDTAQGAKDTARQKKDAVSSKAQELTPDSAGAAGQRAAGAARENPVPIAVAGAFVAGFVVAWILRR